MFCLFCSLCFSLSNPIVSDSFPILHLHVNFSSSMYYQVRALRDLGHDVLCLCGYPEGHSLAETHTSNSHISPVPVPTWRLLTLDCSWREFADRSILFLERILNFNPEIVIGVDWHSIRAFQSLRINGLSKEVPYVFCNYRVYLRDVKTKGEHDTIYELESTAVMESRRVLVLSHSDAEYIRQHYSHALEYHHAALHVLLPPLRADMAALPPVVNVHRDRPYRAKLICNLSQRRHYLTCAVRASPEKEPHRFVQLVCELKERGVLDRLDIIPVLIGSGWKVQDPCFCNPKINTIISQEPHIHSNEGHAFRQQEGKSDGFERIAPLVPDACRICYALSLRMQLEAKVPEAIFMDNFLGPIELAAVYAQTILNVHPCRWDAYGMTVVEAASQSAPSVLDGEGIGAAALLKPSDDLSFHVDMKLPVGEIADQVEEILVDPWRMDQVGKNAMKISRSWTEQANALSLIEHLKHASDPQKLEKRDYEATKTASDGGGHSARENNESGKRGDITCAAHLNPNNETLIPRDPLIHRNAHTRGGIDVYHVSELDVSTFNSRYLEPRRPVILQGVTKDWKVASEWIDNISRSINIHFLEKQYGDDTVPVTAIEKIENRILTECNKIKLREFCQWWNQRSTKPKERDTTFRRCSNSSHPRFKIHKFPLLYLKDWHFAAQHPEYHGYVCPKYFVDDWLNDWLLNDESSNFTGSSESDRSEGDSPSQVPDITIKSYKDDANHDDVSASDYRFVYLGPAGSFTPLHADVLRSHSWSSNISGRKRWQLLPPECCNMLEDATSGSLPLSFEELDNVHNLSPHILEVVQYPGEVLFVPSEWWHTVENLDDCLSINHNWISTSSITLSWKHLQMKRKIAASLIADCRELNGAAAFEALVQRNLAAEAGMNYNGWGKMLRFIGNKIIEQSSSSCLVGGCEINGSGDSHRRTHGASFVSKDIARENLHAVRANKAMVLLKELIGHQKMVLESSSVVSWENSFRHYREDQILLLVEEEENARKALQSEIGANEASLHFLQDHYSH